MAVLEHMFRPTHSFRDPVHGFIRVSGAERRLIDCGVFQRLRRIHQLGTGYLLYHGAEHSRFGHSLGVMHVATRAFEAVSQATPGVLGEENELDKNRQLVRLAALLHDLGHPPFSHAAEGLFPVEPVTGRSFQHEDYTEAIISNSEIGDIIDATFSAMGLSRQSVIDVFKDPASLGRTGILLQDLVAGELDADRMDYLARDSLFAGVTYGRYDLERLLDSIVAFEDEDGVLHLAVDHGGQYALEAFILARYFMFLQVYLHEDRRFYDLALTKVLENFLPGGKYPDPSGWEEYLKSDDINVLQAAASQSRAGDPWARALVNRHHWKVIGTLDESDDRVDAVAWTNAQRDTVERFGEDTVALDDARVRTFQRTGPAPYITRQAEPEERPKISVVDSKGHAHRLEDRSALVNQLAQRRIRIMRLYARPDRIAEVGDYWDRAYSKYR